MFIHGFLICNSSGLDDFPVVIFFHFFPPVLIGFFVFLLV